MSEQIALMCPECGEQGYEDGGQVKFLCGSLLRFFPKAYLDRTSTCHRIAELEAMLREVKSTCIGLLDVKNPGPFYHASLNKTIGLIESVLENQNEASKDAQAD